MQKKKSGEGHKKKKRGLQGGTQPPDSRTRLWKASADGAETSFCVSAFQSFMVLGKNELRRTSFLHWGLAYCWLWPLLDLAGAGLRCSVLILTLHSLILNSVVSRDARRLLWSDGQFRTFSIAVTLLVLWWSLHTSRAARLWIFSRVFCATSHANSVCPSLSPILFDFR